MPAQLSPAAKSKVAAGVAVVMAAVTAWQIATRDGFTWWDITPVAAAVAATACTDHVENTVSRPAAKAVVHGALSLLAALTAALAALVGPEPTGTSAVKLLIVAAGTALVWYVPEAGPTVAAVQAEVRAGAPLPQVAATAAADVSRWMAERPPAPAPAAGPPTQPMPAVTADTPAA